MPTIDLSQLPPPDVVEPLDYESLLAERKAKLISLYPEEQRDAITRTLELESEPLVKLLEENAYRELILRQRVNEAARAVMLAYATNSDLDQLGANYNVTRAVMEPDSTFRDRIQRAFEGLSVAGPIGAYEYHALKVNESIHANKSEYKGEYQTVADVSVISPSPANVTVTVLSRKWKWEKDKEDEEDKEHSGVASQELLDKVIAALNDENVRPVADRVKVQSANIVEYQIDAVLYLYPTPESEPIRKLAQQNMDKYVLDQHKLGRDIRLSAIYAALHVSGVQQVELRAPTKDIILCKDQAPYCTGAKLEIGKTQTADCSKPNPGLIVGGSDE
ncbi:MULTISPECIES: baseplate assembly protein [Photorhabdus]|uniref:Baseplate assembly protein n=2 Tax=Photorhabdus TaxID=29487 RepID=A0ABX0B2P1_9GAMM|nr:MULTISPECIES: baseplate J/gp47 family protein [Photorhabdus]MCC8375129.1 baseplate J/gp47 family protein [Photorhabdus bodei]MCC8466511.1 baseplate J/gp47 family protein [Photorhabdus bodei]MCT8353278.1 baseplate J/gp47 family protein [Photorhabdus kayaii]MDB6369968.1 baseplate J/gp47 family protein [Photorhabdus bodei]MDB6374293.1 baseplate J/gp47 family protein [Photorhabdus bodei]